MGRATQPDAVLSKRGTDIAGGWKLSEAEQEIILPTAYQNVLLNNYQDIVEEHGTVRLHGYQILILEMCVT